MALGFGSYFSLKNTENIPTRNRTTILSIALICFTIYFAVTHLPKNFAVYDQKMKEIASLESDALQVFKVNSNDPKIVTEKIDLGLDDWNKCLIIMDTIQKLNLPPEFANDRLNKIRQYFHLRIEIYHLIKDGIEKNKVDQILINAKNKSLDSLVQNLQGKK